MAKTEFHLFIFLGERDMMGQAARHVEHKHDKDTVGVQISQVA